MYAGTRGKTQGDKNDNKPAEKANINETLFNLYLSPPVLI
jgi:hypothetical protein